MAPMRRLGRLSAVLWNAAEAAERRKDAQVRPRDRAGVAGRPGVLSTEDRIELARSLCSKQHFVSKGLAVQLDVHAPHKERGEEAPGTKARAATIPTGTATEMAARDPEQVLGALTRNNATFTERELDRYLLKHLGPGPDGTPDAAQKEDIAAARTAVMTHGSALALCDRETGEAAGRFTTTTVREQERAALADLQGPGQDAGPHVSAAYASLAGGGELRGADPAARKCAGVCGRGHDARRSPARVANGTGPGAGGVGRMGNSQLRPELAAACRRPRSKRPSLHGRMTRLQPGLRSERQRGNMGIGQRRPVSPSHSSAHDAAAPDRGERVRPTGQGWLESWLSPPFVSPDGKDSLGRGLDNGSVAAAIAANGAVAGRVPVVV